MKRLAFALGTCLLTSSAGFAGPPAAKPAACPYHPGQALTATIRIAVHDREVRADSATVKLHTHIPLGGRTVGGAYVAPPLPLVPVQLENDTLKHFAVTPHFVIDHLDSPGCRLMLDSAIGGRGWALQDTTNFSIDATVTTATFVADTSTNTGTNKSTSVNYGGREITNTLTYHQDLNVSCLDEDVPVRLSSGELIPIKDVVAGDTIADPLTGGYLKVAAVIWGTQADEQMYLLGYGRKSALFTSQHPILTRRGLVAAADVTPNDELFGEDGAYHKLTIRERRTGDAKRSVYNLRFENTARRLDQHLLAANGVVTADFDVQNRLAAERAETHRSVALIDASLAAILRHRPAIALRRR
jgi:hypothetical protein